MADIKQIQVGSTTYDIKEDNAVHYTAESKTAEQKAQARANIGAQETLPDAVANKYLHTDSTGALEWTEVTGSGGGSSVWGQITGTLADQTDLNSALNSKAPQSTTYTKTEVDTALSGKANTSHTHTKSQITDFPTIPSKTSDLTNDSGFIDSSYHDSSKADVSTTYTKSEVDSAISGHHDSTKADVTAISDMATKTWVEGKGYLTEHQSLSAYRTSALQDVIDNGKADKRTIATTLGAVANANTDYFLGEQTTVSVTLPSTPSTGDLISVVFYSGATATSLSVSGTVIGDAPTPAVNQRVELNMLYDGTNWALLSNVMAVA